MDVEIDPASDSPAIPRMAFDHLRSQILEGRVLEPGDDGFDELSLRWSKAIEKKAVRRMPVSALWARDHPVDPASDDLNHLDTLDHLDLASPDNLDDRMVLVVPGAILPRWAF